MKPIKIIKGIALFAFCPAAFFFIGVFSHIVYTEFFYPNREEIRQEEKISEFAVEMAQAMEAEEQITTCDTAYTLVEFDLKEKSQTSTEGMLPEKYLGMTREALEEELFAYEMNPTLEDQEKGFISLQLERFSPEEVVIRKNYHPVEKETGYYLMIREGKIVVMEENLQTVYLTTDILAETLADDLMQELIEGKYVQHVDELYGFLESYSS